MIYNQRVIYHVEHLNDSGRADIPFCHPRIERVTSQIVKTVHIELTGNQLVQEVLWIFSFEDGDGQVQLSVEVLIDLLHHQQGDIFV